MSKDFSCKWLMASCAHMGCHTWLFCTGRSS